MVSQWPIDAGTWDKREPFSMRSGLFERIHVGTRDCPIKYRYASNQEEVLYLIKWSLANDQRGAESLPIWLSSQVGYGDQLIVLDGLVSCGKTHLAQSLKSLQGHIDPDQLSPSLFVLDEPLDEFASELAEARRNPCRVTQVRLQCSILRAWEKHSHEVIDALQNGQKVLVVRGPQSYASFPHPSIPAYAKRVFVGRIKKIISSWMAAQGLVMETPARVCIDVPGSFDQQQARLRAVLNSRKQVGDAYTDDQIAEMIRTIDSINSGNSSLAKELQVARGLTLKWHTAFAELAEWAQRPKSSSIWLPIWVPTDLRFSSVSLEPD